MNLQLQGWALLWQNTQNWCFQVSHYSCEQQPSQPDLRAASKGLLHQQLSNLFGSFFRVFELDPCCKGGSPKQRIKGFALPQPSHEAGRQKWWRPGTTIAVGENNHRDGWASQLSARPELFWCIFIFIASFLQAKDPIQRCTAELSLVCGHKGVFMWLQPQNEGLDELESLTGAHILDFQHRHHWVHSYS